MAGASLDLECIKGETFVLSLELADAGVPFNLTGYTVHFAIAEQLGLAPVVKISSATIGQTEIVIVPNLGKIDISLPYTSTKFEFTKGHYSVAIQSSAGTVTYILLGQWSVTVPSEVLD